jgi:hypothetical protein
MKTTKYHEYVSVGMKKDPWFEFPAKRDSRGRIQIPKDIMDNLPDKSESLTVRIARTMDVKTRVEEKKM